MRLSLNVVDTYSPNGVIVYRGPSKLNGQPIVVVLTGLASASENAKTGDMVQSYILLDDGTRPTDAVQSGADEAVCGDCPHRKVGGAGSCYVNVGQGPTAVHGALSRGRYRAVSPQEAGRLIRGRVVRLGTYGDPAAVPTNVWRSILRHSAGHSGYTHQWRRHHARGLSRWCMASCDTPADRVHAQARGWRTFRVRLTASDPLMRGEFECPASAEQGKRLTCQQCQACSGGSPERASPAIIAHASPLTIKSRVRRLAAVLAERQGGGQ